MKKHIVNVWGRVAGAPYEQTEILKSATCPEGLDVRRVRFVAKGELPLDPSRGHIVSVIRGNPRLRGEETLLLGAGAHCYVPPKHGFAIEGEEGVEVVHVASDHARGEKLLVRDEAFVVACAAGQHALRWTLTPQYLSRRIFLHHDPVLLSKSGNPVSWFHTTMFDVSGLPPNEEGEPVFKMSYNSRTEYNVCYDVAGTARVRMAKHPYRSKGQEWSEWHTLGSDSTYHLNEAAGGPDEEVVEGRPFRNKHEVYIMGGHVSLFCMFDPAPTGVERHRPGEYSDYEPITNLLGTPEYAAHQRAIAELDEMVDALSLAKARGKLDTLRGTPTWLRYETGLASQRAIEQALHAHLASEGAKREAVLARWMAP